MNSKKQNRGHLLDLMKHTREEISKKIMTELSEQQKKMAREDRYPYGGLWLKLSEIKALQKKLKWKHIVILPELLFLFGFILTLSYGIYRLMIWQLFPR